FRILRLYLTHFRGQPSATFQLMPMAAKPTAKAWETLVAPLGLKAAAEGKRVNSPPGAPFFSGLVERTGSRQHPEILVRLDRPASGLAHLFALPMGDAVYLPVRFYLYGDRCADIAAAELAAWQAWTGEHFQAPR